MGYDRDKSANLIKGFTEGFDIGYRGPTNRQNTSNNLPLRVRSCTELWNKVMKEVKESRYAGLYNNLNEVFTNYIQSPLGLVPKSGSKSKTRLIFHLSYDFGSMESQRFVNYYTPKHLYMVKYQDLQKAIQNSIQLLQEAGIEHGTVFYGKTDCSNAFCLVPLLISQCFLLGMMAIHPQTGKKQYFIDKCLPFGSSRSCAIFQEFSDALAFIAIVKMIRDQIVDNPALTNYLDDFLFVALQMVICNAMMQSFLGACQQIGCPISAEKTECCTEIIVSLGMLLNGKVHVVSIPHDKIVKTLNLLQWAIGKRKVTIKFIQQLMDTLNFLNRAIVPGRAFMRGMYSKLKITNAWGQVLKQHHHVWLKKDFVQDCKVWQYFLQHANKVQLCWQFCEFQDDSSATFKTLDFYSDASFNASLGFGAVFQNKWIVGQWPQEFVKMYKQSIEFFELYALAMALTVWKSCEQLNNCRIQIFCDNEAVIHMVNNFVSSCKKCRKLIRLLALQGIQFSRRVRVKYIRLKQNILSDALSQLDFSHFWKHAPKRTNLKPNQLSPTLWPITKVWQDDFDCWEIN